jgi:hypothetical protein
MGEIMRRVLAASILALTAATAAAQQAPPPADPEFRPTQMRLPEFDSGERVIVYGMVPVPDVGEGAPLFTAEDLGKMESETRRVAAETRSDVRKCGGSPTGIVFQPGQRPTLPNLLAQEFEAANRVANAAGKAQQVTERAEQARREAASGSVGMDVVIELELERQTAVNKLQEARAELVEAQAMIGDFQDMSLGQATRAGFGVDWGDLDMRALNRRKEGVGLGLAQPEIPQGLDIQKVAASQHKDKKGRDMVLVRGEIVNNNKGSKTIPDISVVLVDDRGWVLATSTVSPPPFQKGIGGGKTKPFQVEVRPAPEALKTAVVTFAAKHAAEPRMGVSYFCGLAASVYASN